MATVTVVIPALNAADTIGEQLAALARQQSAPAFEVIVVDNGSTDATADVALSFATATMPVRVVHEVKRGINNARNAGIGAAADGVVLLCDADDRVDPMWVAAMSAAIDDRHWAAGAVDYAAANDEATMALWGAPARGVPRVPEPYVDGTYGCNCGFTKSMWQALGGFNPGLSSAGDEHEFFMRASAAGYRPTVVAEAVVAYRLRSGTRAWLRHRYTTGRSNGRAARCAGGWVLAATCRPSRALPRLVWAVLSFPRHAFSRRSRVIWLGGVLRRWGNVVGWFSARDLARAQGR